MDTAKEIIKKGEFEFYGIRMDDRAYNIGDICSKSHQWWQDDPEDGSEYDSDMGCWDGGKLNGTCAFAVNAENLESIMEKAEDFFGYYDKMYLIAGDIAEGGNDDGEIVIEDAKVLSLL